MKRKLFCDFKSSRLAKLHYVPLCISFENYYRDNKSHMTTMFQKDRRDGAEEPSSIIKSDVRILCKEGRLKEALDIIDKRGIHFCCSTYVYLLQGCINMKALTAGKRVHAHMIGSGLKPNIFLLNTLINMYFKCGSVADAQNVFDKMLERDMASWNIMITGYAQHRHNQEVFRVFHQLQKNGGNPNKYTFIGIINACANLGSLEEGKLIHAWIFNSGYESDTFVSSCLVNMYAKCGRMSDAQKVFDKTHKCNVSWNAMISGYTQQGFWEEAFQTFWQMEEKGFKPDKATFVAILKASIGLASIEQGKRIHELISKFGYETDAIVGSTLVTMYAKCGSVLDARRVFDKILKRDVISWNSMIIGCAQHGHGEEAFTLFEQMKQEGSKPDKYTFVGVLNSCSSLEDLQKGKRIHEHIVKSEYERDIVVENALIDMYAKCGSIVDARKVFNKMPKRDVISWNTMIAGYAQHGYGKEAFGLFYQMESEGAMPDKFSFVSILSACGTLATLEEGKKVHAYIVTSGCETDIFINNALIDMYAKCNSLIDAHKVFDNMSKRDVVSWSSMITGYAHGHGEEALKIFSQMQLEGIKPDKFTFIGVVNACANLRALEKGKKIHGQIIASGCEIDASVGNALINMYLKNGSLIDAQQVFDKIINRDVVSCNAMVTGYSRDGQNEQAIKLFHKMQQEGMKADKLSFLQLIGACAMLADLEQGKQIHCKVIENDLNLDVFVGNALINMYAKCRSMVDACKVFDQMLDRDIVTWNLMIVGYAQHGYGKQAFEIFSQMHTEGLKPDKITLVSILKSCATLAALEQGKQIHAYITESGYDSDIFISSTLVCMYSNCGSVVEAWKVFDGIPEHDVVSWNAMIAGYAQHGHGEEALNLFEQMKLEGAKPDEVSFACVLHACSHAAMINEGLNYFESMSQVHGITPTSEHYSCMVDLLGRAGYLEEVNELIVEIPVQPCPVVWMAYLCASKFHGALTLAVLITLCITKLEPQNNAAFVLLSNTHAAAGMWVDRAEVQKLMGERAVKKNTGWSYMNASHPLYSSVQEYYSEIR